tara:strand:+ start:31404 stop:31889 length:486 start_codon:yes stop_codon:yes gene_type:complete
MSAVISKCGLYRYLLEREPGDKPLVFVMLNPSTADAERDDPTIRRCRGFAKELGYTGILVVNLYAFRATKPADLGAAKDPIGIDNDAYILKVCRDRDVCCAWGANGELSRAHEVLSAIHSVSGKTFSLGLTKAGMPRHPLYVKGSQMLLPFDLPRKRLKRD